MIRKIFTILISLFMTTIYSQNDTITLKDVSIYGVRSNKTSPISKSSLDRKILKKTSIGQEVSTVLSQTPNVTFHSDNGTPFGYTYFRMRGLDQTKMNMTLNGAPLNDPEDQGVFLSNFPGFIDNIQSMEIQRGVGTSTNGVASFAGSVNFISPDGTEKGSNLKYTVGEFNTIRTSGTFSSGLSEKKLALYINTSYYRTNGYRYGSGGDGRSVFMSGGYFGENNRLKFTSFIGNSRNGMSWLGVSENDIANNPRTNYNQNDGQDNFTQSFFQLEYTKKLSPSLRLHTSGFYNVLNGGYDYLSAYFTPDGGNRNLFLNSDYFGVINNLNYSSDLLKFDLGVSANSYKRNHSYTWDSSNNNYGVKNEFNTYLKGSYKIEKFYFSTDLQYRSIRFSYNTFRFNTIEWNFFNPKIGLTFQQNSSTNYYLSAGLSHREPTRTYLFNDGSNPADYFSGTLNNTVEKMIDYELGINHRSKIIYLQANLFFMDFMREIAQSGGTQPSGVPNSELVKNSYRAGVELDTKVILSDNLSISYNGAFNKSSVNGKEHILLPRFNHNLRATFEKKGFLLEILSKSQSSSYLDLDNQYSIPSFTRIDSNIGYTNKDYSIVLSVNNITSVTYFTNGYFGAFIPPSFEFDNSRQLFANPPINAFVTIKYLF